MKRNSHSLPGGLNQIGGTQPTEYKSLKDFRKGKELPKFKFNSDIVKEILNTKSELYNQPNVPRVQDVHQKTWTMKMHQLQHPSSVKFVKNGIESVRSQSYNLLQTIRTKTIEEVKAKNNGREGAETDFNNTNRQERQFDYNLSAAEQEKYLRIQKEYLEFFIEMGLPIPKDKNDLFKVIILKDYYSHDEDQKKRQNAIQKLEKEGNSLKSKLNLIDRRQESKIISQANKNFNIYVHANRLKHEDIDYLKDLNDQINLKIKYCTQPSLMQQVMTKKKVNTTKDSQDNSSFLNEPKQKTSKLNGKRVIMKQKPSPEKLPSLNVRIANMKAQESDLQFSLKSPKLQQMQSSHTNPSQVKTSTDQQATFAAMANSNMPQAHNQTLYSTLQQSLSQDMLHGKLLNQQLSQEDILLHQNDQYKSQVKEYFQKMYRKNKIKRSKAPNILFKPNLLSDQFDFFLKNLKEKSQRDAILKQTPMLGNRLTSVVSQLSLNSPSMMNSPPQKQASYTISNDNNYNTVQVDKKKFGDIKLSDIFVEQNKFLPEKLFSVKKIKEYSMGLPIEDEGSEANSKKDDNYFRLSKESMRTFNECQDKLVGMRSVLDEREKDFLKKALRDYNEQY